MNKPQKIEKANKQSKQKSIRLISKILFSFTILFTPFWSVACGAYGSEQAVNSKIKEVTVFLNGAQVHRSGNFNLNKGVTEIVFKKLSPYINPKSIQAKGRGNFTILEVRHHVHHPIPKEVKNTGLPLHVKRSIQKLEDSLLNSSFALSEIETTKKTLELEKSIMLSTEIFQGKGKASDSIPLLKDGMAFFREKLSDINKKVFVLNRKEHFHKEAQKRMNTRLTELKQYKIKTVPQKVESPIQQVIVTVSSKQAIRASIDINYMVSQAGWSAQYDLRAANTSSPIKLTYKAKVFQKTGEDWNNVKLKLSTNDPNRGNIKPSLPIWYINFRARRNVITRNLNSIESMSAIGSKKYKKPRFKENMDDIQFEEPAISSAEYTKMANNISIVEFKIDLPYNIESNGESHMVEVQTSSLPSKFHHTIVPKLDREAFVMAKISDWQKLNLLPASANIFFDGTYIGETYINPIQLDDTLNISLGRDPSIVVKRNKLKDDDKTRTIGNNRIKTISYELVLKNNKQSTINLTVEDHVPVSRNDEIKVNVEDHGTAYLDDITGALRWNIKLNKGVEKKLNFSYSIKYDKNRPLLGAL